VGNSMNTMEKWINILGKSINAMEKSMKSANGKF
jgi:hypothetical protein